MLKLLFLIVGLGLSGVCEARYRVIQFTEPLRGYSTWNRDVFDHPALGSPYTLTLHFQTGSSPKHEYATIDLNGRRFIIHAPSTFHIGFSVLSDGRSNGGAYVSSMRTNSEYIDNNSVYIEVYLPDAFTDLSQDATFYDVAEERSLFVLSRDPVGRQNQTRVTSSSNAREGSPNYSTITIGDDVPEPATWSLFIGGLGITGLVSRRRRRRQLRQEPS